MRKKEYYIHHFLAARLYSTTAADLPMAPAGGHSSYDLNVNFIKLHVCVVEFTQLIKIQVCTLNVDCALDQIEV